MTHTKENTMSIKKYRLAGPLSSAMLDDERLTFTERGVLGFLSTKVNKHGFPVFTVLNVPLGELTTHEQMITILDRLVDTGWLEVIE